MGSILIFSLLTVAPISAGTPSQSLINVDFSPGSQISPRLDGEFACYLSESANPGGPSEVRYFHFPTGTRFTVPNPTASNVGFNCDIDAKRIVLSTSLTSSVFEVELFDIAGGAMTTPSATYLNQNQPAIGGNTVAFSQNFPGASYELVVVDLLTSTVTRLTNDTVVDGRPSVSPDGNTVVWERGQPGNYRIYRAVRSGGAWSISAISTSLFPEFEPRTNGDVAVFTRADGMGETDVVSVNLSTGAETVWEVPGVEHSPSVSGRFIVFDNLTSVSRMIFVLDSVSSLLFHVATVPTTFPPEPDISAIEFEVRVVWTTGSVQDNNIVSSTFTAPRLVWDRFSWDTASWQ